jgi:hypothetical protein
MEKELDKEDRLWQLAVGRDLAGILTPWQETIAGASW